MSIASPYSFVGTQPLTVDHVIAAVASHYDMSRDTLVSKGRSYPKKRAKQMAIFIIAETFPEMSLNQIARYFEGDNGLPPDHTTIMHSKNAAGLRLTEDKKYKDDRFAIRASLKLEELPAGFFTKDSVTEVMIDGAGFRLPSETVQKLADISDPQTYRYNIEKVKQEYQPVFEPKWTFR